MIDTAALINELMGQKAYYIRHREIEVNKDTREEEEVFGTPVQVMLSAKQPYSTRIYIADRGVEKKYDLELYDWDRTQEIKELDLICIDVESDAEPDYRIMEIEKYPTHNQIYLERRWTADGNIK